MNLEAGDVISFKYPTSGEKERKILVLTPDLNGMLHGLDMDHMSIIEKAILYIMRHSKYISDSPQFYEHFVKGFIKGRDIYRVFCINKMVDTKVISFDLKQV